MSMMTMIAVLTSSPDDTIEDTVGTLINAVSIDDYGAVGDGTTDDTAAFVAAFATGFNVYIPKDKTYKIVGTDGGGVSGVLAASKMQEGQKIFGEDRLTSKIKVTGNGRGIQLAKDCGVYNLTFVGNGKASGQVWNAGLITYDIGFEISGCRFEEFSGNQTTGTGGGGIFGIGNTSASPDFKEGGKIMDCDFFENVCGLNLGARAEYITVGNCRMIRNTYGFANHGGNNVYYGLNVINNTNGGYIKGGTNDGHGTISASRFNHNTKNLIFDDITLGMTLIGTHVYAGAMDILDSVGIKFIGCDLVGDGETLTVTNSTVLIDGCRYPESPTSGAFVLSASGSTITEGHNMNF